VSDGVVVGWSGRRAKQRPASGRAGLRDMMPLSALRERARGRACLSRGARRFFARVPKDAAARAPSPYFGPARPSYERSVRIVNGFDSEPTLVALSGHFCGGALSARVSVCEVWPLRRAA